MKSTILNIITFLAFYLPFEDFILKWLPVSELTFTLIRQFPDLIIFNLCLIIFTTTIYKKNKINLVQKQLFIIISLFIINAIFTLIINNANFFNGFINLKALIRYIFLIYILDYAKPDIKFITNIIKLLFFITFLQMTIGFAQYIFGDHFKIFFQPRMLHTTNLKMNFSSSKKDAYVFGTMSQVASFAYFVMFNSIIWLFTGHKFIKSRFIFYFIFSLFLIVTYISGSRAGFICTLLGLLFYIYYNKGFKISIIIFFISSVIFLSALPFIDKGKSYNDFFYMFSPNFVKILEKQRLGVFKHVFLNYIKDSKSLMGLSPDKEKVLDYIKKKYALPPALNHILNLILEDVYWVAMFIFYGLFGLLLFIIFIFMIYKKISKGKNIFNEIQIICKILTFFVIIINFKGQILEIRQFAFYYWLFIAYALNESSSSKNNESNKIGILEYNEDITNK